MIEDIKIAIGYVEKSLETHKLWIAHLKKYPNWNTEEVGNIKDHQQAKREYEFVLRVLKAAEVKKIVGGSDE